MVGSSAAEEAKDEGKSTANQGKAAEPSSGQQSTIRVSIEKIDEIINLVGELVITQSILSESYSKIDPVSEELRSGIDQLERHTRDLQDSVMQIRMLPISFVFNRFPRVVRDLSAKLGKDIHLEIIGEHTELDKTVLESISDPLIHLVRNSVDHGIELPEARKAVGKRPQGTVTLEAFHEGGNVVIEITDDGAGINLKKVQKLAREKGLIGPEDIVTGENVAEILFMPGFSTADEITDVSGRGVGMDVVKRNIREMGGTIELETNAGKGSCFTVRLPLTVAIIDGQLANVSGQTYVIPLLAVIESVQLNSEDVSAIASGTRLFKFRGEYIPVVSIAELFGLGGLTEECDNGLLIIVESEGMKSGIWVDEMLGQQQVVIKGLETNYRSIDGISGATILGDGKVALILDIPGIVNNKRWFSNAKNNSSSAGQIT